MFFPLSDGEAARWLLLPLVIFWRYVVACAVFYLVFYVWKRRAWLARKVQQRWPTSRDYRREVGYSFVTALIFGAMAWLWLGTPLRRHTRFYTDVGDYGVPYLVGSVFLAVLIHDTYFYWTHRLMHHPRLYRHFHRVHHLSVNPSPWAAYAFHPYEAVVEAGILPVLLLVLPLHPLGLFGFMTFMLWFNVYGHVGYELYPRWMFRHPVGRWLNAATYHNQHHERFTGNFGLYLSVWDRAMGTLAPTNDAKIEEVFARIEAETGHSFEGSGVGIPGSRRCSAAVPRRGKRLPGSDSD